MIAQLEVTYANGSTQTIATDPSWLTRLGPTTFSSWWGGEDYDARLIQPNWTASPRDLTGPGWDHASLAALTSTTIPSTATVLAANPRPPVTVAAEARPASITKVTPRPTPPCSSPVPSLE
jgi:alpha-L-rhamnosidase